LWPLVEVAIEPNSPADAKNLRHALSKRSAEDSELSFYTDAEAGRTIIYVTSEARLDAHISVIRSFHEVNAEWGRVQVAYHETIGQKTEATYTHKKQAGGSEQYAEVTIVFEPVARHTGIVFEDKTVGGSVPPEYIPAIDKGVRLQARTGVRAGFPTVDFKFTLKDGRFHDVDSNALAFEIAAKACFRELGRTGSVTILEPVMKVEVVTPYTYAHAIMSDLRQRSRGAAEVGPHGDPTMITALVPLRAMLRYAATLNGLSDGKARHSLQYEAHREVSWPEPPDDRFPPAIAMRA
jgi:elongation factor G